MVASLHWLDDALPVPGRVDVRQRIWLALRKHGWNASSFQIMGSGYHYWFDPAGRGCVAYQDTGGAWVVAGAPVAAAADLAAVAATFGQAAITAGRRCCFFGTESRFDCGDAVGRLLLGEQPVWDPKSWDDTVASSRSLREQLRRARAKGVLVRRISAADAVGSMQPTIQALRDRWLASRKMAAMGFVVRPQLFALAPERRFYIAQRDGKLCGVLVAVPVYARKGWLFEHLLRDDDAPNGTTDALVDLAMRDVAADGARYATLGLAPLSGGVNRWLKLAARLGAPLYSFDGVRAFKQRLRPDRWEPIYLSYPRRHHGFVVMLDVLSAFANGSLLRFGLRTLRRKIRRLSPA